MVINSTNIDKTTLIIPRLKSLSTKKTMVYADGNPGPGIGRTQKCGGAKQIDGIPNPLW